MLFGEPAPHAVTESGTYPMTGMPAAGETGCSRADDVHIHSKLRAFMFTSKVRIRMRKSMVVGGNFPQVVALYSTLDTVARNGNVMFLLLTVSSLKGSSHANEVVPFLWCQATTAQQDATRNVFCFLCRGMVIHMSLVSS
jgi:hypothetical protein